MKMILAVISGDDQKRVKEGLLRGGFRFTVLASTGGFLRVKSVTLLCGVSDERVSAALDVLRATCGARKVSSAHLTEAGRYANVATEIPSEYTFGGATVFVLNIENFQKM